MVERQETSAQIVELAARAGRASAVVWHGMPLGWVEERVDGWHGYVHHRLDLTCSRHIGHRAMASRADAVELVIGCFVGPGAEIQLSPTGFRVDAVSWSAEGEPISTAVMLSASSVMGRPIWLATITGPAGELTWSVSTSGVHGSFEVWSTNGGACGLVPDLGAAAHLIAGLAGMRP